MQKIIKKLENLSYILCYLIMILFSTANFVKDTFTSWTKPCWNIFIKVIIFIGDLYWVPKPVNCLPIFLDSALSILLSL